MSEKGNSRAYSRKMSFKKALRKKRIAEEVHGLTYDNLHQYSKNKIHCSCPCCSPKTKGKRGFTYTHSDLKKVLSMDAQVKELAFAP